MSPMVITKGTTAQKPHSNLSDKIPAMIDNDSSKSIIARDMEVFEFLTRLEMNEDIRYFSYKMRKGQFLSQAIKDKR